MSRTTWAARTAKFAVLATVFAAGGTGVAVAGSTTGSGGVGSGNQVSVPLSISANVCGNAIAVLGDAFGGCESAASASSASHSSTSHHSTSHSSTSHHSTSHHNASHNSASASGAAASSQTTSGSHSIAGGNQVSAPVSVPVTVCGHAAAVLGRAMGGCEPAASASGAAASSQTTSGSLVRPGRRAGQRRGGGFADDVGQPLHRGRQPGQRAGERAGHGVRQRGRRSR